MRNPLIVFIAFLGGTGACYSVLSEATVAARHETTDIAGAITCGLLIALLVRAAMRARA